MPARPNLEVAHAAPDFVPDLARPTPWLGQLRIRTDAATGLFTTDPTGDLAYILGVEDDSRNLVDLVAWMKTDTSAWWMQQADMTFILGARTLAIAAWHGDAIDLHPTPLAWVRAGGRGCAVLCWDLDLRPYFEGMSAINCRHPDLPARLEANWRSWEPRPRVMALDSQATASQLLEFKDCSRWVGRDPTPLTWTAEGLVPEGMTTLLVAGGGAGKSLLQQTLMTCIPTGHSFLGRVTAPGSAAALFAEDPEGILHHRQVRINEALGVEMDDLVDRAFPLSLCGEDMVLWYEGRATRLFRDLETALTGIEALRYLALDNAALVYADSENDRVSVTRFLNALNGLAQRLQIGIVLSAHTSKSSDDTALRAASGSTAWVNACRSVLKLEKTNDPDHATLKLVKANHTKPGLEIPLHWEDGILKAELEPVGEFGTIERNRAETVFLELLTVTTAMGMAVNHARQANNYAPRAFKPFDAAKKVKTKDLEAAMFRLLERGTIRVEEYGRPSATHTKLVRADITEATLV